MKRGNTTQKTPGSRKQQPSFVQYFDYCKRQYIEEVLQKLHENNRQYLCKYFQKITSKIFISFKMYVGIFGILCIKCNRSRICSNYLYMQV
jgi:hypothetical protein